MRNLLTTLLLMLLCCFAKAAVQEPALLPMPQKVVYTGKYAKAANPVKEKIVGSINGAVFQDEAYHIVVGQNETLVEATTERGLNWARQTLAQLTIDNKARRLCHNAR